MVYGTGNRTIDRALDRVLAGDRLDRTDGLALYAQPVEQLIDAGATIRDEFGDGTVDACSIVNAKAGNCAEDCGFCAQSVHFDTGIETYGFIGPERVLEAAKQAERDGAQRFGIVVAEKGVSKERRPEEWAEVLAAIRLVREDIAHLPEYDLEDARSMSDAEIEAVIDDHDGVLEFTDMEHADDVLLERAGVCDAEDVSVGGILDVRNDEKPTTTTVTVTGRTFDGRTATNTFQLGDETSMAANVNGPALGYLRAAVERNRAGEYGVLGPAELLPRF